MSVGKMMAQENLCSECPQTRDCKAVYRQLGDAKAPCVVTKVLVAFLLPIAVFIASLAVFDYTLTQAVSSDKGRIALSFLLAAGVSFVCILITRAINSRLAKSKSPRTSQGEVV
jgi:small-conductance mechanosensitive channel